MAGYGSRRAKVAQWLGFVLVATGILLGRPCGASSLPTATSGWADMLKLNKDQVSKEFEVHQIGSSSPANIFYPKEPVTLDLQFVNKTTQPIRCKGTLELSSCGTQSDPADVFNVTAYKIADFRPVPITVDLPASGYQNLNVTVPLPDRFGCYLLVANLADHGRDFAAAVVRSIAPAPGRVQFPRFALDDPYILDPGYFGVTNTLDFHQRLGIKGMREEIGYVPTTSADFEKTMDRLAERFKMIQDHDVAVMLTIENGSAPQPLGVSPRRWLNDKDEMVDSPQQGDMAWLPQYDEDFQKWVKIVVERFGWPKGPVNAVELWNEPWDGLSISGWGADIPRYREIYTRMAEGVEDARKESDIQVLIGGTCSSMNTDDKLFCDGTDTFLKWLDFTSIHYQPLATEPALVPAYLNRKSPNGPVRFWDTESWIANSEDRVAAVLASMRATGLERTAGVLHEAARYFQDYKPQPPGKTDRVLMVEPLPLAPAIAASQAFIGQRPFKEILFKNGLPWIFRFDSPDNPDDGTLVVVGDLSGVYRPTDLLFRGVRGQSTASSAEKMAKLKAQIAVLPSDSPDLKPLQTQLSALAQLHDATLTLPDDHGHFRLYDFDGNQAPSRRGKIHVPLNVFGYYLRTDGRKGSFEQLVDATREARIDGYEPAWIVPHDMTAPLDSHPSLRITITNILNRPIAGKLLATLGSPDAPLTLQPAQQALALAPHESRDFKVLVSGPPTASNTYPLAVVVDAGADGKATHEEDVRINVIPNRTITVDGNLDDWKGVLPQPMHSDTVAGAKLTEKAWLPFLKFDETTGTGFAIVYTSYDDKNFYFAAKIADSTPWDGGTRYETRDDDSYFYPETSYQVTRDAKGEVTSRKELTWPDGVRRFSYRKGYDNPAGSGTDNVLIGFGVLPPGENGLLACTPGTMPGFQMMKTLDYEFAFNQVADKFGGGTEIWKLLAPGMPYIHFIPRQPKRPDNGGPVKDGKLVMRRDGDTRIVEASIPWSEMPDVKKKVDAGQTVRFNCRVNDNSGPTYELSEGRSVSKTQQYGFHELWTTSWTNELEFAFEK